MDKPTNAYASPADQLADLMLAAAGSHTYVCAYCNRSAWIPERIDIDADLADETDLEWADARARQYDAMNREREEDVRQLAEHVATGHSGPADLLRIVVAFPFQGHSPGTQGAADHGVGGYVAP